MPINSEINTNLNAIIRTVTGKLISDEIKNVFAKSLAHPDFKKNMNAIWDLTEADISEASLDQFMDIINYIREHFNTRGSDYKIILVAPIDESFNLSRIFQSFGSELLTSIQVVKSLNEAYKCLE